MTPAVRTATVDEREDASVRPQVRAAPILAVWVAVLVIARVWGYWIVHYQGTDLYLGAVPLFGTWNWLLTQRLLVPIAVGAGACMALPALSLSWPWRRVLVAVALVTVAWGAALAFTDAPTSSWSSIGTDYTQHAHLVDEQGPGGFLRDYVGHQSVFPTHLQAHPPGMVMLLWLAGRFGFDGDGFDALLALGGAAVAAVAAIAALRDVVGESLARRVAPFVVIAPAAVWHTNPDTFYAGVTLGAVALVVLATSRSGRRATTLAVAGGALFGGALLLTYGIGLLALPMVVVAAVRRRLGLLSLAIVAAVAVVALPSLWGFNWLAGLHATKHQYDLNLARVRPYSYFVFANLAVFALALGPAVAVGLARLRDRKVWLLAGSGLAAVALADVSGLSSGEVERIWQPFMPLVLLGAAGLVAAARPRQRSAQTWLIAQAATAIVLQAALRTPW